MVKISLVPSDFRQFLKSLTIEAVIGPCPSCDWILRTGTLQQLLFFDKDEKGKENEVGKGAFTSHSDFLSIWERDYEVKNK